VVWAARDIQSNQQVAVKLCQIESSSCEQLRTEWDLLQTALRDCSCGPSVVAFDQDGDQLALVETPVGVNLADYLEHCNMRPRQKAGLLQNLALRTVTALLEIHRRGVLHRDVNPYNLIVVNEDIKVIDFGSAVRLSESPGGFGATPAYASLNYRSGGDPCAMDDFESLCYTVYALESGVDEWLACELPPSLAEIRQKSYIVRQLSKHQDKFITLNIS
jgi:serine/threonine protein kinase